MPVSTHLSNAIVPHSIKPYNTCNGLQALDFQHLYPFLFSILCKWILYHIDVNIFTTWMTLIWIRILIWWDLKENLDGRLRYFIIIIHNWTKLSLDLLHESPQSSVCKIFIHILDLMPGLLHYIQGVFKSSGTFSVIFWGLICNLVLSPKYYPPLPKHHFQCCCHFWKQYVFWNHM